jgi:hypothetical protein
MKRYFLYFTIYIFTLVGCETPQPQESETTQEPDTITFPENPLSTLEGDIVVSFDGDNSLSYADCFGDYYHTGAYMWGLYFQQYTTKEQLYVEIMHPEHIFQIPHGTYTTSDNINDINIILNGCIDQDGYQAYSWYTRLATDAQSSATAPIFDGSITIEQTGEELYKVTFDLIDDRGYKIAGVYEGRMILEDFRIN